jgi:hypothetical protein
MKEGPEPIYVAKNAGAKVSINARIVSDSSYSAVIVSPKNTHTYLCIAFWYVPGVVLPATFLF